MLREGKGKKEGNEGVGSKKRRRKENNFLEK